MKTLEFTGKKTEEAINKAIEHFKLPLDKLQIEMVSAGSSGFLGFIGVKKARIKVRPLADSAQEAMNEVMDEFQRPNKNQMKVKNQTIETTSPLKQNNKKFFEKRETSKNLNISQKKENKIQKKIENNNEPDANEIDIITKTSKQALKRMLSAFDTKAKVTVKNISASSIYLEIESEEIGILIGKHGQTLDALQYLTIRIVSHQQGRPVRIIVDAGGYRSRRQESLEELAYRMASKAKNSKRPVSIGPFSSPERRLIHMALINENGVSTSSRGRGEMKKVLIIPH